MKLALIGATGFVGSEVLKEGVDCGYESDDVRTSAA
jgi:putative NADH-flavin reductase